MKLGAKGIETKEPETLFGDEAVDLLESNENATATADGDEIGNDDDTDIVDRDDKEEKPQLQYTGAVVVEEIPSDLTGEVEVASSDGDKQESADDNTAKQQAENVARQSKFKEALREIEWKESIREAQERLTMIAIEHRRATENAKSLKKQMESALESVETIIARGPEKPMPLFEQHDDEQVSRSFGIAPKSAMVPVGENDKESKQAANESDAWKSRPIEELELGNSLTERLIENGIGTIGRLENLRAEIAQGREKWPKGIGEAKITKIEDAVIDWLTKNRDSGVFGQQVESEESETAELVESEQPKAEPLGEPATVLIKKEIRYQGGKLEVGDLYDVERNSEGNLSAVLPDGKGLVELDDFSYEVFKRKPIAEANPVAELEPVGADFFADL
jgi:hypothetical protein